MSKKKKTIKPPTKKELTDASKQLKKGHPSGGRTMADESVAVRQGVVKKENDKEYRLSQFETYEHCIG